MAHKSLGQIAYEATHLAGWDYTPGVEKARYDRMAQAVADELRKGEWICTRCGIRQDSKHESHGDF